MRMVTALGVAGIAMSGVLAPAVASADPLHMPLNSHQPGFDHGHGHGHHGWGDRDDDSWHLLPDII